MTNTKKILLAACIIIVVIQFIRPARNSNDQVLTTDISKVISIPDSVQVILDKACYDCHSNNTDYPWYSNIQPVGWLLTKHIKKGKNDLNFSEFGGYSARRQLSKLDGIAENVSADDMPLKSYRLMHKNAQLHQNEKDLLIDWAQHSRDILSAKE
jgi:hypothetical protein